MPTIISLSKQKSNICKLMIQQKISINEYKSQRNKITNIIRVKKRQYFTHFCNNNKKNSKAIWTLLNNLKGDAKNQASTNISANEFNSYFSEVASKLIISNLLDNNNNNANQSHRVYLNMPNIKSFVFIDTNPNEIITTVYTMPKKQSTGY